MRKRFADTETCDLHRHTDPWQTAFVPYVPDHRVWLLPLAGEQRVECTTYSLDAWSSTPMTTKALVVAGPDPAAIPVALRSCQPQRAASHEPQATSHEPRATSHEPRATSREP